MVNALSEYLKAEIHRDGQIWQQEYKAGKALKMLKLLEKLKTGTIITFKPDSSIFTETEFSWGRILDRLRQQSYLTKGITMNIIDQRPDHSLKKYRFYFEGGIKSYIKSLHRQKNVMHDTIFYLEKILMMLK